MYSEISHHLLYFVSDKSFDVREVDKNIVTEEVFEKICARDQKSMKIKADFDGLVYDAIVVIFASSDDCLFHVLEFCVKLKRTPFNFTIEQILRQLPPIHNGRRLSLPNLNVSNYYIL
jgi:hypothetical protein